MLHRTEIDARLGREARIAATIAVNIDKIVFLVSTKYSLF